MKIPSPFLLLAFASIIQADDLPDPAVVSAAMRKANDYYVSQLASHGGYASSWKTDLSLAFAEGKESKARYRLGPTLTFDPKTERHTGDHADAANALLSDRHSTAFPIPSISEVG
jgi:hypothetical protein